jgi:hypothetical protein
VTAETDVCYICKNDPKFRPFCSRCGGTGQNVPLASKTDLAPGNPIRTKEDALRVIFNLPLHPADDARNAAALEIAKRVAADALHAQLPDETSRDARGFPLAKPGIPIEARCAACSMPMVSTDDEYFIHDCDCMHRGALKAPAEPTTTGEKIKRRMQDEVAAAPNQNGWHFWVFDDDGGDHVLAMMGPELQAASFTVPKDSVRAKVLREFAASQVKTEAKCICAPIADGVVTAPYCPAHPR